MSGKKALLVPKKEGENTRKMLLDSKHLDTSRKIITKGDFLEIPIHEGKANWPYPLIEQEQVYHYERSPTLKELMTSSLDGRTIELLPRSWQVQGDVVITSLHSDLYNIRCLVGDALLKMYPYCKSVFMDMGVGGELRVPKRELIAVREGVEDPGSTLLTENECRFFLDVTQVMFSKGNLNERIRMSRLGAGEDIIDMFAGIGYFSIAMAVHARPKNVVAIELNPVAYQYLVKNIRLNHVEDTVEPLHGDCAELAPSSAADRVVMGYVGTTSRYLEYGIRALRPGGVLHYHDTVPAGTAPGLPMEWIEAVAAGQGRRAEMLHWSRVKKYSPGIEHVVVDARVY